MFPFCHCSKQCNDQVHKCLFAHRVDTKKWNFSLRFGYFNVKSSHRQIRFPPPPQDTCFWGNWGLSWPLGPRALEWGFLASQGSLGSLRGCPTPRYIHTLHLPTRCAWGSSHRTCLVPATCSILFSIQIMKRYIAGERVSQRKPTTNCSSPWTFMSHAERNYFS